MNMKVYITKVMGKAILEDIEACPNSINWVCSQTIKSAWATSQDESNMYFILLRLSDHFTLEENNFFMRTFHFGYNQAIKIHNHTLELHEAKTIWDNHDDIRKACPYPRLKKALYTYYQDNCC